MHTIKSWFVAIAGVCAFGGAPALLAAGPDGNQRHVETSTNLLTPLSFDALLVSDHPLVTALAAAAETHDRSRRQMGSLDANPVLTVTPGARVVGINAPGPEWAIGIAQDFALGDQLDARAEALALEGRQLAIEVDVARLERRLGAAHLWLESWRLAATLAVLSDELVLCDATLEAARKAVARGALTRVDLLVLESWRSDIALKRLGVEGQLVELGAALGQALGRDAAGQGPSAQAVTLPVASGPLPTPPETAPEHLRTLIAGLPGQRLNEVATLLESARLRELEATRDLRMTVSLQADADAEQNTAMRLGFSMHLPTFDTQDRDVPQQRARQVRQAAEVETSRREIAYRVLMLEHELHHTREVLGEISSVTLPAVERVVEVQQVRLAAGEITVFEVVDTRRRRLEILSRQQDAEVAHTRARLEAWLLWQASTPSSARDASRGSEGKTP